MADKLPFYQNVHDLMSKTGSDFPLPTLTYVEGNAQIELFRKAQLLALTKVKGSSAALKETIILTERTIDSWSDYVESIALGAKSIIENAGFNATVGDSTPGKATEQPILTTNNPDIAGVMNFDVELLVGDNILYNLIVATDLSGIMQLGNVVKFEPVVGVIYYTLSSMQRKLSMGGLPKVTQLYAICYTTNRAGNSVLSKVVEFSC